MDVEEHQAEDFSEVEPRNHFFKGLLARARGIFVDEDVQGCAWQDEMFVVKGAVFAVDGNGHFGGEVHVRDFADGAAVFHVRCVTACAEDGADLGLRVRVVGGDEGSCRVVDEGGEFDGEVAGLEGGVEEGGDVVAFDARDVEAFGPALEDAVVNVFLGGRVGEGEAEGDVARFFEVFDFVVVFDELLDAVGNVFPEFFACAGLEFFGHLVLGLYYLKLSLCFGEDDLADSEIGAAHVEG